MGDKKTDGREIEEGCVFIFKKRKVGGRQGMCVCVCVEFGDIAVDVLT